jgi:hypothetical protein
MKISISFLSSIIFLFTIIFLSYCSNQPTQVEIPAEVAQEANETSIDTTIGKTTIVIKNGSVNNVDGDITIVQDFSEK